MKDITTNGRLDDGGDSYDPTVPSILGSKGVLGSSEMNEILAIMEKLLHWAAIIESSDDAIISKSVDGYITSWNKGAQQLYGYSREEVIGQPVSILMPTEKANDFPMIMSKLLAGEKVEHYETKRKTKDGRILDVSLTVSPIKDNHGSIIGASKIARDITEKVEAERQRDDFVSAVSHELKTPITSQKVYGELLEEHLKESKDSKAKKYIRKMNEQNEKLSKLVNDLLELSRVRLGKFTYHFENYDLGDVITTVVEDLQPTCKHQIIIDDLVKANVFADKERIEQVLTNLIINAAKYSPGQKKIIIRSTLEGDHVVTSIQDFGIGIPTDYHKQIFERFFRVTGKDERTFSGLGIGLNFCERIIDKHHGRIWVESQSGKGSTFYFSLPIAKAKKGAVKNAQAISS